MAANAPFDFSAMSELLNDPSIREMADKIAQDPAFAQMTQALQGSLASGGPEGSAPQAIDPNQYAQAMSSILENGDFMKMAEGLGRKIMEQDPNVSQMMSAFNNPASRQAMEDRLKDLQADPDLAPIMREIEASGPGALMKYWEDPNVIEKFGKAMGDVFEATEEVEAETGEGEDAQPDDLHSAAQGQPEMLKQLLAGDAEVDEPDEEGRTPLHFAAGFGEVECLNILLDAGAKLDAVDNNGNTALHYAAGYGRPDCCTILLKKGIDLEATNTDGKTAAEVAELNGKDDVLEVLKEDVVASKDK